MESTISSRDPDIDKLRSAWREQKTRAGARARDAARILGVTEAELVASECGEEATRLEGDFRDLFKRLPGLGPVMALTRNESCVHERVGTFEDVSFDGHVGLVLGPDIDLRIFMHAWRFGYAVEDSSTGSKKRSLQFFDAHGVAIHKVHLRPESDTQAFNDLVAAFRAADQSPGETVALPAAARTDRPDSEIDVGALRAAWASMTDTHEFFPMLRRFDVGREQALRLADPKFSQRLQPSTVRELLEEAARAAVPIMVFVGNPGMIQIHTGPVENIRPMGPWLNVMDPAFNLHLREDHIASVWLVRKPTNDGIVTSIEPFDEAGNNIALFFGKRKPGIPEDDAWRALLDRVIDARGASA